MKIAMIGQRGLPATHGGVEHHVEELGSRLAARGHDVTVYSRQGYSSFTGPYRGMDVRSANYVGSKHLEAVSHSAFSTLDAIVHNFDIIHYHAVGPGILSPISRLSRAKVVQTIHGLDHERQKWGPISSVLLRSATWVSARSPHVTIGVSPALCEYYRLRYGRHAYYVPNGVRAQRELSGLPHSRAQEKFFLFVGRVVPEKQVLELVRAFSGARDLEWKLVIAGGPSHTSPYFERVQKEASKDARISMTGYVYGEELSGLYRTASAFVLPSSVEGMPLSVLEAASFSLPLILSDIRPHSDLINANGIKSALTHPPGDVTALRSKLYELADSLDEYLISARALGPVIKTNYSWDAAADQLVELYDAALSGHLNANPIG